MPHHQKPKRYPINESLSGVVSRFDGAFFLSARVPPSAQPVLQGDFVLRYAIPYLYKPQWSIVPDLVVLDYGETMSGELAWDFLMKSSHLFPRSDVLGYRNDGIDDMIPFKQLDFDSPYDVFAYQKPSDSQPVALLSALIAGAEDDRSAFPERLLRNLPRFPSLDDWLNRE